MLDKLNTDKKVVGTKQVKEHYLMEMQKWYI